MQQETPTIPHLWLLLSNAVTAILAVITTLTTIRFKQKREPAEVRKIDAEARNIHISAEVAQHGIAIETWREIQSVIDKAEVRREAWLLKEEQLRGQIVFWRNKAEESDGQLADAQETIWKLESESKGYESQIKRMNLTLQNHHLNYDDSQDKKIGPLPDVEETDGL